MSAIKRPESGIGLQPLSKRLTYTISIVFPLMVASCALPLPNHEIGLMYRAENTNRSVTDRVVVGFDIRKGTACGAAVGYSRNTQVREPSAEKSKPTSIGYQFPLAMAWENYSGGSSILGWALIPDPVSASETRFVHETVFGAGVLYNSHHQSALLGLCDAATLKPHLNAVHKLHYSHDRRLNSYLSLSKNSNIQTQL